MGIPSTHELAPIALFVFNRPDHAKRVIESLKSNPLAAESELFIFADTPKTFGQKGVSEVRDIILALDGFKDIKIIVRDHHFGLSKNTIQGLTQLSKSHGKFIMLEDDTVCSPHFLEWTNFFLEKFKNESKVAAVQGYVYPAGLPRKNFFLHGPDTWGWGTWSSTWKLFEPNGKKLRDEILFRDVVEKFNMDGAYDYFGMLEDQIVGINDSWSIRWYASTFLAEKLTLYPAKSLIRNIGFDGSGTNCTATTRVLDCELAETPVTTCFGRIEEDKQARKQLVQFLKTQNWRIFWDCMIHCRWLTIIKALWKRI